MNPPALPPALLEYQTEHFVLGEELQRLLGVRRVGATEAEIFYATRILEVLTGEALRAVRLPATPNTFANLLVLQQLNLLPSATRYWAHALRRTGNVVRHLQRRVGPGDAELAALLLERWLGWFFAGYRHGPRLKDLSPEALCLHDGADPHLRALMLTLDRGAFGPDGLLPEDAPILAVVLRAPTLPAIASELLLERGDPGAARRIALVALERFPDDLRLRQLVGLAFSRQKELEQARHWLEPLLERYPDDEETLGIAAGLFKRLAETRPDGGAWLARAHRAYLQGWRLSKHANAYLGVNAATTALALGKPSRGQELARDVRDLLLNRLTLLGGTAADASAVLGYWDSVTLAEAYLLLRDFAAARTIYREAFAGEAALPGSREVTRQQLGRLLRLLGAGTDVDAFLLEGAGAGRGGDAEGRTGAAKPLTMPRGGE